MSTEPGLQAGDFPPMYRPHPGHRRAHGIGLLVLIGTAACAPAVTPRTEPTVVPAPVVTPAPDVPRPLVYAIPSPVTATRYRLESVIALERDSAGRRESQAMTSRAEALVRVRRTPDGGFEADGQLFGYTVTSALSTTPIAIDSLRFDAVLDSLALRVVSQPPLANECDRPETGALALVRDMLLRVPASLTVGDRWRDSSVHVVCRASLPMIVRTTSEYVVTGVERGSEGVQLLLRRTSASRVSGTSSSPWRSVEVTGTGDGVDDARIVVQTGAVERIEGTSTLTLTVTDRTVPTRVRSQQVVQRIRSTARALGR